MPYCSIEEAWGDSFHSQTPDTSGSRPSKPTIHEEENNALMHESSTQQSHPNTLHAGVSLDCEKNQEGSAFSGKPSKKKHRAYLKEDVPDVLLTEDDMKHIRRKHRPTKITASQEDDTSRKSGHARPVEIHHRRAHSSTMYQERHDDSSSDYDQEEDRRYISTSLQHDPGYRNRVRKEMLHGNPNRNHDRYMEDEAGDDHDDHSSISTEMEMDGAIIKKHPGPKNHLFASIKALSQEEQEEALTPRRKKGRDRGRGRGRNKNRREKRLPSSYYATSQESHPRDEYEGYTGYNKYDSYNSPIDDAYEDDLNYRPTPPPDYNRIRERSREYRSHRPVRKSTFKRTLDLEDIQDLAEEHVIHHKKSKMEELFDILLYIVTGVFIIFILDVFVRLGRKNL